MKVGDALSEQQLKRTFEDLQTKLPEKDGTKPTEWIINEIERELWEAIAGESGSSEDSIKYSQLQVPEPFIGYVEQDNDEEESEQLPWWLESFEWEFEMAGRETIKTQKGLNEIERLEDFDPENTDVCRPNYSPTKSRRSLKTLLNGLSTLKDELVESANISKSKREFLDEDEKHPQLPTNLFELSSGGSVSTTREKSEPVITTSKEFKQWLESIIEICPPYNETTTALTWYNTGLRRKAVEQMLEDMHLLENAGLTSQDDRIMNRKYRDAFSDIMAFQGVFDWEIEVDPSIDSLEDTGLEAAYIDAWVSNIDSLDEREAEALRLAHLSGAHHNDKNNEMKYARCCVKLPVSYDGARNIRLTFDTQNRKKRGGLYRKNEQEPRSTQIYESIKYNFFPELDS